MRSLARLLGLLALAVSAVVLRPVNSYQGFMIKSTGTAQTPALAILGVVATALGIEPIRTITLRFVPFAPTLTTPTLTTPTLSTEHTHRVPGESSSPAPGATRSDEPGGQSSACAAHQGPG